VQHFGFVHEGTHLPELCSCPWASTSQEEAEERSVRGELQAISGEASARSEVRRSLRKSGSPSQVPEPRFWPGLVDLLERQGPEAFRSYVLASLREGRASGVGGTDSYIHGYRRNYGTVVEARRLERELALVPV
jgi:hypothetical protein